jgi:uncharacterized protein YjbI with pentapeptide repeats
MMRPINNNAETQAVSIFRAKQWFGWCKMLLSALLPLILGIFTVIYTMQQNNIAKQNREQDLAIATAIREQDQSQADELRIQTIYDTFINDISARLLDKNFNASNEKLLVHIRAKTLDSLRQVDTERKRNIIIFLYEIFLLHRHRQPEIDISEADLRDVKFIDGSSFSCAFKWLALRNVLANNISFYMCNSNEAVFDGSMMNYSQFIGSYIVRASFVSAHLMGAVFSKSNFRYANFTNADLSYSNFSIHPFMNVDLTNADLFGSDITDAHLIQNEYPNILLNTHFSNGSFSDIDASNLVINNGAELSVSSLNEVVGVS